MISLLSQERIGRRKRKRLKVSSSPIWYEAILFELIEEVLEDIQSVIRKTRVEETLDDEERVPVVDLSVSTTGHDNGVVQRDERAIASPVAQSRRVGFSIEGIHDQTLCRMFIPHRAEKRLTESDRSSS
jgi:hypothetical protein